jgi:hypothetical protein
MLGYSWKILTHNQHNHLQKYYRRLCSQLVFRLEENTFIWQLKLKPGFYIDFNLKYVT